MPHADDIAAAEAPRRALEGNQSHLPGFTNPAFRGSRMMRALPALVALLILGWGAAPYLPGQIDDVYIVFAYAHHIVEHGEIAWNTGVRVEGYSSPLHLALMALGALAGADLPIFATVLAFVCSALVVLCLTRPFLGPNRYLLALLVAAWQPFEYWSTAGLETTLATLVAVVAWPLVLGRRDEWARGVLLLVLFSVTRPEGLAWLGVALGRRLTLGRASGSPERLVLAGLIALALYHAARVSYFGYLLPTTYLVKIAAIEQYGAGFRQLARELVSASGILVATVLFRSRISPWAWIPLLIQGSLLVRAGGDWMGHARFLVPGLVATVAAAWTHGTPRQQRPAPALGLVAVFGIFGFAWEPSHEGFVNGKGTLGAGWRNPWFLRHPGDAFRTPWSVPLLEETSFLIERVPTGAGAAISDVGLPGNLDDVRIWDSAGLTDRVTARVIASESGEIVQELLDRYHHGNDVWCIRYGVGPNREEPADIWMQELLPEVVPSGSLHMVWRCRAGGEPSRDTVVQRWARLVERYPSQDWIRWYYARALVTAGHTCESIEVARGARTLGADGLGWLAFGEGQSTAYHQGRGWALYANGVRSSIEATADFWTGILVQLDVDDPGQDGAKLNLRWDRSCSGSLDIVVHERVSIEPPPCAVDGPRKLVVEFLNDHAHEGFDRNVYVSLVRP